MRSLLLTFALLMATASFMFAQSLFSGSMKNEYRITNCTSICKGVKVQNGVVTQSTGTVSGTITFNSKNCFIKLADRKINYKPENLTVKNLDHSCLTSGFGNVDGAGDASFQLIEDFNSDEINILFAWPDNSSVRVIAKFVSKKELQ